MSKKDNIILVVFSVFLTFAGCWLSGCRKSAVSTDRRSPEVSVGEASTSGVSDAKSAVSRQADHRHGTSYATASLDFLSAPRVDEIPLPSLEHVNAIWGSVGRDDAGQIYFGASATGPHNPSAHLLRFQPSSKRLTVLGSINDQLDQLKVRRYDQVPECQQKIHSKIFEADDGYLYFSSQNELDEDPHGASNSRFGGRLMRIHPASGTWESVFESPHALIAVGCAGRYVYAQGYFGGHLYQFDTLEGKVSSVQIGAFKGHVPRNIVVDRREHVFMVRTQVAPLGTPARLVSGRRSERAIAELVEVDSSLDVIGSWPLSDYPVTGDTDSHGLTGYCILESGGIFLTAESGACWLVTPGGTERESILERLGWFHPAGPAYVASVFCPYGDRYVMGLARVRGQGFDWIVYDLKELVGYQLDFDPVSRRLLDGEGLGLWGTHTMDDFHAAYVVGWKKTGNLNVPCAFRLSWSLSQKEQPPQ